MPVLVLAGDSITYGFWDTQGGWAGRLRSFLDKRCLDANDPETLNTTRYTAIYNLGIPGDTSSGLRDRFEGEVAPRLDDEQETVVLIAIGTNDSAFDTETDAHQVSLEKTKENIKYLIDAAKKISSKIVVLGLPPVDEARTNPIYWHPQIRYTNDYLQAYDQAIKQTAEKEGVLFVDIFGKMKDLDVAGLMEDGIHPNAKGHQMLFELIKDFLIVSKII